MRMDAIVLGYVSGCLLLIGWRVWMGYKQTGAMLIGMMCGAAGAVTLGLLLALD